jgi:hypothetical protein
MARPLTILEKEEILTLFKSSGNIKQVAAQLKRSKNTVKKVVKNDFQYPQSSQEHRTDRIGFVFLEKLFDRASHSAEQLKFKEDILELTLTIAKEIGVISTADQLRLEMAMAEFIHYRRYFFLALSATQQSYVGHYSKAYDKQTKVTISWIEQYQRAMDRWSNLIRELEIKYGKRFASKGTNIFVQNNIQNNT